jgi:hypothetical protein
VQEERVVSQALLNRVDCGRRRGSAKSTISSSGAVPLAEALESSS